MHELYETVAVILEPGIFSWCNKCLENFRNEIVVTMMQKESVERSVMRRTSQSQNASV